MQTIRRLINLTRKIDNQKKAREERNCWIRALALAQIIPIDFHPKKTKVNNDLKFKMPKCQRE